MATPPRSCKWYNSWNPWEAYMSKVDKWFRRNPGHLTPIDVVQVSYLQQKSIATTQIVSSSSRGDFNQQIEKIL